ncbi:transcriptional regulator GcvA [Rhodospirillum rubrum]|uniref:Transcriptional regulator, LysR family n=1 Tax=Rhodospirillum rubrum (strain ATCC 11170 / ATH 1.1.1 / DSM 467 / LMG 4362 / NCIMB 8255 / S1) TaxID=269796 RepID=Q2RNY3_RHORT|nr:transcriptional regulator GcvA [Rhodospirillum rubrum]ABC24162.1 transcriptional regulator, LysR family [Rhodospirillum rubrum ATCC 11170]AEO49913.1 LysR family transcriptional regulator [Rhodospirillum rubrum F11]MBK5955875.1 LysR family transcriptional regulator [Rhodospirillum rubrum]QXG80102.1 transcriptional regulator GcvA [Rhodospirillum rubrum]HAP98636.1 LysR family transcriptional regulator [Rhodospirillum rubrum]
MPRDLPPLNALRAFTAAAKRLSFTQAAEDLGVTQAAVSHQIRGLEDWLGVALFRRRNKQVVMTEAGQVYALAIGQALDEIAEATAALVRNDPRAGMLTISTMPSFAIKWLVQRLGGFINANPDIEVRLHTTRELVNFATEGIDVAIRMTREVGDDLHADLLLEEELFPVCSPALMRGIRPLRQPSDLSQHLLLQDVGISWVSWLDPAGALDVRPARGPGYLDSALAIQACIESQGVMLGRTVMVEDDLKAGRLVEPFTLRVPSPMKYWLVCPPGHLARPGVRAFREWILAEASKWTKARSSAHGVED